MGDFLRKLTKTDYSGIFELHVTVKYHKNRSKTKKKVKEGENEDLNEDLNEGLNLFEKFCKENKCKKIYIQLLPLQANNKKANKMSAPQQMMTSSYERSNNLGEVQRKCLLLSSKLVSEGFWIERTKVEAMMSNEGVPSTPLQASLFHSPLNYFEFHIKLILPLSPPTTSLSPPNTSLSPSNTSPSPSDNFNSLQAPALSSVNCEAINFTSHSSSTFNLSQLSLLSHLCEKHEAHLSKNAFSMSEGEERRFVTMRLYLTGKDAALEKLECLLSDLLSHNFQVDSKMREYSVWDSNVQLDKGWITL